MSMSADIHDTILSFCIDNNIPQNKAVALLRDIVDDMNGDGDSYDFSFVANEYAKSNVAAQQSVHADAACACPDDGNLQINSDFVCAVCHKTPRR